MKNFILIFTALFLLTPALIADPVKRPEDKLFELHRLDTDHDPRGMILQDPTDKRNLKGRYGSGNPAMRSSSRWGSIWLCSPSYRRVPLRKKLLICTTSARYNGKIPDDRHFY